MGVFVGQVLSGLSDAGSLFLVGAGLTLIFGSLRLINVAHGSFYMYAAFLVTAVLTGAVTGLGFLVALIVAPLAVAALGLVVELSIMRRLYGREHLSQLLATFGLFYILADLGIVIWGPNDRSVGLPPVLAGHFQILGTTAPVYGLFVIAVAVLAGLAMMALLSRTMLGWRIRAAVEDRELLAVTGSNVALVYTVVFTMGALLAGLAGAVAAPQISVAPGLDQSILIDAFIVSVVGGLGSIPGAAVAALLIGLANSFGIAYAPSLAPVAVFVIMIAVLVVRPAGILGRPGTGD